jgi:hypothetical protein
VAKHSIEVDEPGNGRQGVEALPVLNALRSQTQERWGLCAADFSILQHKAPEVQVMSLAHISRPDSTDARTWIIVVLSDDGYSRLSLGPVNNRPQESVKLNKKTDTSTSHGDGRFVTGRKHLPNP